MSGRTQQQKTYKKGLRKKGKDLHCEYDLSKRSNSKHVYKNKDNRD